MDLELPQLQQWTRRERLRFWDYNYLIRGLPIYIICMYTIIFPLQWCLLKINQMRSNLMGTVMYMSVCLWGTGTVFGIFPSCIQ